MQSIHKQPELDSELKDLFALSRGENFEDDIESAFSRNLVALIEKHENIAIDLISDLIASGNVDLEVASEALRWVGHIENSATYQARLQLLERSLFSLSARIRDGAILGLASMDDPASIRYVKEAIRRETIGELRQSIQQLLEQLIDTQLESSPLATMIASEDVLRREWESDAEESAWAHL